MPRAHGPATDYVIRSRWLLNHKETSPDRSFRRLIRSPLVKQYRMSYEDEPIASDETPSDELSPTEEATADEPTLFDESPTDGPLAAGPAADPNTPSQHQPWRVRGFDPQPAPADETPLEEAPADESNSDEAQTDVPASDEATADEAQTDVPASDESAADKAPANKAPADEAPSRQSPRRRGPDRRARLRWLRRPWPQASASDCLDRPWLRRTDPDSARGNPADA